jgi:hypothetical protein
VTYCENEKNCFAGFETWMLFAYPSFANFSSAEQSAMENRTQTIQPIINILFRYGLQTFFILKHKGTV